MTKIWVREGRQCAKRNRTTKNKKGSYKKKFKKTNQNKTKKGCVTAAEGCNLIMCGFGLVSGDLPTTHDFASIFQLQLKDDYMVSSFSNEGSPSAYYDQACIIDIQTFIFPVS